MLTMLTALAATLAAPAFVERPCTQPDLGPVARCGSVTVPEDRRRRGSRTIALNLVILPATGPRPDLPPLFDLEGGPGLPATKNASFYLTDGTPYRERRDVVLLDQRGTGGSNALRCPELTVPGEALAPMLPVVGVASCRRRLEQVADLNRYGTADAVADLDDVRRALGAARIDLFGLSYGTTVALRYMATYPGKVRAAVLLATAPPSTMPPRYHAQAADQALDQLFADCAADPACRAAFPDPAADMRRVAARSDPAPAIFFEKLRALLYAPGSARRVPLILNRAAAGDLAPFRAAIQSPLSSLYADGMFLSVTCSESFKLMNFEAASAQARATRFGDYRLQRQQAACAGWPAVKPPSAHLKPVRSDAAVLLVSGGRDPVTPPAWADEVARFLPNSRHIVIPDAGHIIEGLPGAGECLDAMALPFFAAGSVSVIDAGCVARLTPPAFVLR